MHIGMTGQRNDWLVVVDKIFRDVILNYALRSIVGKPLTISGSTNPKTLSLARLCTLVSRSGNVRIDP